MKKMLKKISLLLIMAMIVGIFQTGEVFAESKYNWIGSFYKGVARAYDKDGVTLVNKEGKQLVKSGKYDSIEFFVEGMTYVSKDGKYGFIDTKGKEVVKPKYDSVGDFSEGVAFVLKDDKSGLIDKKGKEIVKLGKYDEVGEIKEGMAKVRKGKAKSMDL